MTADEKKQFNDLYDLMREQRKNNEKLQEQIEIFMKITNEKLDKKYLPLTLEERVFERINLSLQDAIEKQLVKEYDNPLQKYVKMLIDRNSDEIILVMQKAITNVLTDTKFKEALTQGINHKVARTLVSSVESDLDKIIVDLKQDKTFRAKLLLTVNDLVKNYNKGV